MHCPRDQAELLVESHNGIDIDRCPQCKGGWLDEGELSQLEASCPKCGKRMSAFNYRAYNLELDVCNDRHGFWLDQGEAIRVRELVEERVQGLERSAKAEAEWGNFVDDLKDGPSFWDRLTGKG